MRPEDRYLASHRDDHDYACRCNRPEFPPSQFFPRGKNGPAHSFPGEKIGRPILSPPSQFPPPPTNNFKNNNGIIISLYKFKKPLLN